MLTLLERIDKIKHMNVFNSKTLMNGTDNVHDLSKARAFKEAIRLYTGYKNKLFAMNQDELLEERQKLDQEMKNYPNHLLTLAKAQIFNNAFEQKGTR